MGVTALISLAIVIVVVGLVAAFGADITSDIQDDYTGVTSCGLNASGGTGGTIVYTGCGFAYNNTEDALVGISETTERLDTVAVVVVAGIIITILVGAFAFVLSRR